MGYVGMQVTHKRKALLVGGMVLFLILLPLVGVFNPMETLGGQSKDGGNDGRLISPAQAQAKATAGLYATPWIDKASPAAERDELTAAQPLLVQRVDRQDSDYYLVPFNINDLTVIVVIVDAKSGRFKECAKMGRPDVYPKVNATQARQLLVTYLSATSQNGSTPSPSLQLVWRPCQQTQSPYEPLWRVQSHSSQWFVDQNGVVHPQITEIQLKGGGPDKK
jgi:hypothetical protein